MIAITTSSSMSVKPRLTRRAGISDPSVREAWLEFCIHWCHDPSRGCQDRGKDEILHAAPAADNPRVQELKMDDEPRLDNEVRAQRDRRGWSQQELARRSGLSRAGISAIETGRLVPSTGAALALAEALGCKVEDLFRLSRTRPAEEGGESPWAWVPNQTDSRYWRADMAGRLRAYPVELSPLGLLPHDGVFEEGRFREHARHAPEHTLIVACCDPAVGLLAQELASLAAVRLIVFQRSSVAALELLGKGLIHAAGVHLARADDPGASRAMVRDRLAARPDSGAGSDYRLLHVAGWDEGLALAPGLGLKSVRSVLGSRLRWVRREAGSAARLCLDELLSSSSSTSGQSSKRSGLAFDHRGVAEAIRGGWADAGVCLRLTSLEANLDFLSLREESYDLCFPSTMAGDPRLQSLVRAVQSTAYRRLLAGLPGYHTDRTGELQRVER
jgi:molybdate-binding protein/transcriptional regulator with XRE-family HTH domain